MQLAILLQNVTCRSILRVLSHWNQRFQMHHVRLLQVGKQQQQKELLFHFAATFHTTPRSHYMLSSIRRCLSKQVAMFCSSIYGNFTTSSPVRFFPQARKKRPVDEVGNFTDIAMQFSGTLWQRKTPLSCIRFTQLRRWLPLVRKYTRK